MIPKVLLITWLLVSLPAAAHDLYLVNGVSGAERRICARIGEQFPGSESAVTPDRLEVFAVRTARTPFRKLQGKVAGNQLCAAAPEAKSFVAEMIVHPRYIKLESKLFDSYVEGEGLRQVLDARGQQGAGVDGRELYSRYAKLIKGRGGLNVLGHTLEIVLEKDPADLKAGDSLPVQVLFRGRPLVDAQVAAVHAGADLKGHKYPVVARTDAEGRAALKLDRVGLWYARLIHMVPAEGDPEVDWRSFFATVTFSLPATQGRL
jgi:hypothetical protein